MSFVLSIQPPWNSPCTLPWSLSKCRLDTVQVPTTMATDQEVTAVEWVDTIALANVSSTEGKVLTTIGLTREEVWEAVTTTTEDLPSKMVVYIGRRTYLYMNLTLRIGVYYYHTLQLE